jgi:hypothetical protein
MELGPSFLLSWSAIVHITPDVNPAGGTLALMNAFGWGDSGGAMPSPPPDVAFDPQLAAASEIVSAISIVII